ncbi:MAG: ABC transporter ATP-binding protein [Bacteroidota bacterium]
MGLLEVAGIASILPFMQLLAEPEAVESNRWLKSAYDWFEFETQRELLIATGIFVIVLLTISNLFSAFTIWLQYRFIWRTMHDLSVRLLYTYIKKPYEYYLNQNTADLRAYIITEVGNLASGIMLPIIEMVSRVMVALVIFGLLIIANPSIAISSLFVLGGLYLTIYLIQQRYIKRLGEDRITYNAKRYRSLYELLSGIKTVKAFEAHHFFYNRYERASNEFVKIMPNFNVVMLTPRYILEIFAFGGILAITLFLYVSSGDIGGALPMLSLYAFAGYRLLPALQKAFAAATKLKHNYPILDKLYDDLIYSLRDISAPKPENSKLSFKQTLSIKDITFQYENTDKPVLNKFSVTIKKGETVAFVGSTGSGKTTIIDVLMGLLVGSKGEISVDDQLLSEDNMAAWHHQTAYVPQDVFLFDETIARNIMFGVEEERIDKEQLAKAARMADIYDFVQSLPKGFQTVIGERGMRLSGGQRQRIGLARALYFDPDVLIMDEATSALDNITEKSIIASLETLPDDLTVIIVAHRLSTVRYADIIYLLENGKIVAAGGYEELIESNSTFREMVELS